MSYAIPDSLAKQDIEAFNFSSLKLCYFTNILNLIKGTVPKMSGFSTKPRGSHIQLRNISGKSTIGLCFTNSQQQWSPVTTSENIEIVTRVL